MSEYNFEPDYAAWWKKKSLSKEDLCWLMLGPSPDDIAKHIRISNDENSTHDEKQWNIAFYGHCYARAPFLGNEFKNNMKLLQCESKEGIFQEAYESYIEIYPAFYDFLLTKKAIKPREDLEIYKDHSLFEKNAAKGEHKIMNENYAFAKVIGVEESYFDRFICLDDICENEPVDINDFRAYANFKPEEKWFYSEYGKYIGKFYDAHHSDVTRFLRKIKTHNLWKGEFKRYCQDLHDAGFIFRNKTYEILRQQGIHLEYSKDGWAYKFHSNWVKRKALWTLEEAGKLYTGADPLGGREFFGFGEFQKGDSGHSLHDFKTVLFLDENGEWKEPILKNFYDETSLENFVKRYVAKGVIIPTYENGEKSEFEPKEIIQFLKDYCPNTCQPKALFSVLGIYETTKLSEERKTLTKSVSKESIIGRTRNSQLHDLIGNIIVTLGYQNKTAPAQMIWNHIRKNADDYEIVQEITDNEITWRSYRGYEQAMKRERFNTVVSDYNTGKKAYPKAA